MYITNDHKKLPKKYKVALNRQNNDLWVKRATPDTEIGQGQIFYEYELVQCEYFHNLGTNENI